MSFLEITGFLFGIAGVWLTIKEHWSCFPVGLVNVGVSLVLFFNQKLYSDTLQQAVYIVLLSYGWYQWQKKVQQKRPVIGFMDQQMKLYTLILFIATSFLMGYLFKTFTDAAVPYLDAAATSMSFIAQYLIAKKKIENWLIWMAVNILYIGIYTYKGLYLYSVLFLIYLVLAIKGYITWKTEMKTPQKTVANV